jgi:hypothetical protein
MAMILAVAVALVQLALAAGVFASIAEPERSWMSLEKVPLHWRLFALLAWSLLTGIVLQVGGAGAAFR